MVPTQHKRPSCLKIPQVGSIFIAWRISPSWRAAGQDPRSTSMRWHWPSLSPTRGRPTRWSVRPTVRLPKKSTPSSRSRTATPPCSRQPSVPSTPESSRGPSRSSSRRPNEPWTSPPRRAAIAFRQAALAAQRTGDVDGSDHWMRLAGREYLRVSEDTRTPLPFIREAAVMAAKCFLSVENLHVATKGLRRAQAIESVLRADDDLMAAGTAIPFRRPETSDPRSPAPDATSEERLSDVRESDRRDPSTEWSTGIPGDPLRWAGRDAEGARTKERVGPTPAGPRGQQRRGLRAP